MQEIAQHLALEQRQVAVRLAVPVGFAFMLVDDFLDLCAKRLIDVGSE
jgi:hypothetical protein